MRNLILKVATAVLASALLLSPCTSATFGRELTAPVAVFPIADVIAQVKAELNAAQSTTGAELGISLQKVAVNFALTQGGDKNGKVVVGVPMLGGAELGGSSSGKNEATSSLLVELVPPKGGGPAMSATELADLGLTQAIVSTRAQLLQGLKQKPELLPNKVVITLKFVVTRTAGATGQIKFLVVSVGGGATTASASTSSIELTFGKGGGLT